MGLPALHLGASRPLALARRFEFSDKPRLLELGEGACDLAHSDLEWVVSVGEVVAREGKHTHTAPNQSENAKLLGDEVANRLASSTITVRTPLLSIRSRRAANPGRTSI